MFKFTSKRIALISIFIALCVVINSFEINLSNELKLSFTITVCTLAGLFTGFIGGAITGFLGDLLGCIFTGLTPIPLLSVSNALLGFIPGLAFDLCRRFIGGISAVKGIIIIVICQLLLFSTVTLFINTYAIWDFYDFGAKTTKSYLVWTVARVFPVQLLNSLMNLVVSCLLFLAILRVSFFKEYLNFNKAENKVEEQIECCNDSNADN